MFLVIAFSSGDGQDTLAVVLFAVIGWADYLDGFAARLTGQYSRLGALLDPIVDRLLVISGMAVAWNFELLPRWAIAVVIGRELFMLAISRYALSRGLELKINWPGRLGVAPTPHVGPSSRMLLHQQLPQTGRPPPARSHPPACAPRQ